MNIQKYINSGIVEDYCLGLLSASEMATVVQYAAKYNEIRIAIDECELLLKKYAEEALNHNGQHGAA